MTLQNVSQLTATFFVYRRLVLLWCFGPVTAFALPLIVRCSLLVLKVATAGFAGLALALFLAISAVVYYVIVALTVDNPTARHKALWKNAANWPYWAFSCAALARFVVGPAAAYFGVNCKGPHSAVVVSIPHALRLTTVLAVSGLAVVARFVGPKSIVRCSTVPLASNPLYTSVHEFLRHPILALLQPSDTPGEILSLDSCRRFQRPSWSVTVSQAMIAIVAGIVVALTISRAWLLPHNDIPPQQQLITFLAIDFSVVLTLLTSSFPSHELDPKEHYLHAPTFMGRFTSTLQQAVRSTLSIAMATCVLQGSLDGSVLPDVAWILPLTVTCFFIMFYMYLLDKVIRYRLFRPSVDLQMLVSEVEDDGTIHPFTRCLVQAIIRNDELAKDIFATPNGIGHSAVLRNVEYEELEQCRVLAHKLAWIMMDAYPNEPPEAMLEQDVMQMAFLKAMSVPRPEICTLLSTQLARRQPQQQHPAIAAIRALTVVVFGMAEAMVRCLSKLQPVGRQWALPPGFLCAAEFAVQALAACIAHSITQAYGDWKVSIVSILIPTSVESIFALRSAIDQWGGLSSQQQQQQSPRGAGAAGVVISEELKTLRTACDAAAATILKASPGIPLQPQTMVWARQEVLGRPL